MRLKDRVALVTGGSGGIGGAVCRGLAAAGAVVALHYHRQEQVAQVVAEQMRTAGHRVEIYQADVADPTQAWALVDRVVEELGSLDILVNNAGITIGGEYVVDTSIEAWEQVMAVNLNSVFYMARAVLPHMRRQGRGQIINISSNVVNTLPGGSAAYATSKSGVIALTKVLSKEEARHNIRVNAVSPGMINAGMGVGALERRSPEQARRFLDTIPLGRSGEAEEVAPVVVFLAADEASYITGQNFNVNGGDRTESYQ